MKNTSRCREKMEGQIGRWRTYRCQECHDEFSRFLVRPLPAKARICNQCLEQPELRRQYDEAFEERDRRERDGG